MADIKIEIRDSDNSIEGVLDISQPTKFPFTINKSLSDFKEFTQRSGVFSVSFRIPGTKKNNQLLKHFYDANVKEYYEIGGEKDAVLLVEGIEMERGKLTVDKVIHKDGFDFECRFWASNLEWVILLKDVYLNDLTFTNNSITYNSTTIENSWTNTYTDEWVFSLVNRGTRHSVFGASVEDFAPDLFVRSVIDKIFAKIGYTVESTFFDTAGFKSLILLYFGNKFQLSDSTVKDNSVRTFINGGWTDSFVGFFTGATKTIKFNNDSTPPNHDVNDNFNTATFKFTAPFPGYYNFTIHSSVSVAFVGAWLLPRLSYRLNVNGNYFYNYINDLNAIDILTSTEVNTETSGNIYLNTGETVFAEVVLSPQPNQTVFGNFDLIHDSDTFMEVSVDPIIAVNNTFNLTDVLDDEKMNMLDFVNDLTRMFNLFWRTNNALKRVYCEPRDEFYKDLDEAVDWTQKLDISKQWELIDLSKIYKRNLDFQYKPDSSDKKLAARNKWAGNIAAAHEHDFSDLFQEGTKKIETKHLAATYSADDPQLVTITEDSQDKSPYLARLWQEDSASPPEWSWDFSPRIVSYKYGTQLNSNNTNRIFRVDWQFGVKTNIPYCLMFPIVVNTIVWASVDENLSFGYDGINSLDGLVSDHYGKTLKIIEEGHQLILWLKLTNTDMKALDFRVPIYFSAPAEIKGYWLIEKIHTFSPTKLNVVKVTLLQYKNYERVNIPLLEIDESEEIKYIPSKKAFKAGGANPDEPQANNKQTPSFALNNGLGNKVSAGTGSFVAGQFLDVRGQQQTVFGRYNDPANTSDIFVVGSGTDDDNRADAIRVNKDGEPTFYGGEVFMENSDGEIVPVYITGTDDRIKNVMIE